MSVLHTADCSAAALPPTAADTIRCYASDGLTNLNTRNRGAVFVPQWRCLNFFRLFVPVSVLSFFRLVCWYGSIDVFTQSESTLSCVNEGRFRIQFSDQIIKLVCFQKQFISSTCIHKQESSFPWWGASILPDLGQNRTTLANLYSSTPWPEEDNSC